MTQYIPKDALVAEIERRKNQFMSQADDFHSLGMGEKKDHFAILASNMHSILSFLDTLEVKEDNLLTEKKTEKELAEAYIKVFDKKFGNKIPRLKGKRLADFKNFINMCEQTFCMKYFDYHATQGKLFEKLALLWAVWGKEHLTLEVKEEELDFTKEVDMWIKDNRDTNGFFNVPEFAKHFFELGMCVNNKAQKGE